MPHKKDIGFGYQTEFQSFQAIKEMIFGYIGITYHWI